MEKVRSLLVDLDAEPSIVPLTRARRPSFGSPTAPALRAIAEGGVPVPTTAMPPLGGRSSTWPYGSARAPRTSSSVPRAGVATPSGSLTGIPPVASAMARSGGVPSLPASATTTPRTNTVVPIGLRRAAAMVIGGDALGEADGAAEGEGGCRGRRREAGSGRWRRPTVGVGSTVGDGDRVGVGVGDGGSSASVSAWGSERAWGWDSGSGSLSASGSRSLLARATASGSASPKRRAMDSPDGVALGAGIGPAARPWATGAALTTKSAALSFVSTELPSGPPGRRSIELPAAGAGAAIPSTKAFVASPQATASTGWPPIGRTTIAPPVAAKPPEYVASAEAA